MIYEFEGFKNLWKQRLRQLKAYITNIELIHYCESVSKYLTFTFRGYMSGYL